MMRSFSFERCWYLTLCVVLLTLLFLSACGSGSQTTPTVSTATKVTMTTTTTTIATGAPVTLTVNVANANSVYITNNVDSTRISVPAGGGTVTVNPVKTTIYTVTATGANNQQATAVVTVTVNGSATGSSTYSLQSINHIIFMFQENHTFDSYFGQMNPYRASLGLSTDVDDLTNPSFALNPNPSYNAGAQGPPIAPFKMKSACIEDLTPSWNESHTDRNLNAPSSTTATPMNGFAYEAGAYATNNSLVDVTGKRAMGYYDQSVVNYYYFMAVQFAIGDKFFSPVMAKSEPNYLYALAATSQGWIEVPTAQVSAPTIFNLLQNAGISWKIYYTDADPSTGKPDTYAGYFSKLTPYISTNVVPLAQYYTDLQNGTLPAVAFIDSGRESGTDEHPSTNVQTGAQKTEQIINALMQSTSWSSSAFILSWDESGGYYDHVPPAATVNPDGIPPNIAANLTDKSTFNDNFTWTGVRLPNLIISPFTKKGYVSHAPMDSTAILKLIETRFGLPNLTLRDAAQPNMATEFFDFANAPNMTPPVPPVQLTNAPCYYNTLP
jgi:phospholipase C